MILCLAKMANHHFQKQQIGLMLCVQYVEKKQKEKLTQWILLLIHRGISYDFLTLIMLKHFLIKILWKSGCQLIFILVARSIRQCTCSIPVFGTKFFLILVLSVIMNRI